MGVIDQLIKENGDITSKEGFDKVMKGAAKAPDGELFYLLTYSSDGQSVDFKKKQAIARAELDRRQFKAQRGLVWVSAVVGVAGVLVGAALQAILTVLLSGQS